MGISCSLKQRHKDKDSVSTRSEESPASHLVVKKTSNGDYKILEEEKDHSGVITGPSETASGPEARRETMSLPSPPVLSPQDVFEPILPQELIQLPETYQNLLTGRVSHVKPEIKTRKIVLYVCAATSQDCHVEKGLLHSVVGPELRSYCRDKGYELHISDLHWENEFEKQPDYEFPEYCLNELSRQMEVSYIVPIVFLSNSLGTPLLPETMTPQDFELALSQIRDKEGLKKWYRLEDGVTPPCQQLIPFAGHIAALKDKSALNIRRATEELIAGMEKALTMLITVFSDELKDKYLTTGVEREIQNTIYKSQEMARRSIWLCRVFTHRQESRQQQSIWAQEQKRRLKIIQKNLRSHMTEKQVLRLTVKWAQSGIIDASIPEHAQYISEVTSHLTKSLKATIFNIIEEDQNKNVIRSSYGVEGELLNELKWQAYFCQKTSQTPVNCEFVLEKVRSYIEGGATFPLLLHGFQGCGKTTVMAKIAHCVETFSPEAYSLFRFIKISELSYNMIDILKTVCDQLSLMCNGYHTYCDYNINSYSNLFPELISAVSLQRPIVVLLDGLDHIKITDLNWLPKKLPNNAKIIISARTRSSFFRLFKSMFQEEDFVEVELAKTEAESVFVSYATEYSTSMTMETAHEILSSLQCSRCPLYIKVLAWRMSLYNEPGQEFIVKTNLKEEINALLAHLDKVLGVDKVKLTLSLLLTSKYGLRDSELLDILSHESIFHSDKTYLPWGPAALFLSLFYDHMKPFLQWVTDGNNLTLKVADQFFEEVIRQRYPQQTRVYRALLQTYFKGTWHTENDKKLTGKFLSQPNKTEKCYNRRKLVELPYQSILLKENILNDFFLNPSWLFDKINGCGVFQVIDDMLQSNPEDLSKDLEILKNMLESRHQALNYDGRQMYTQFQEELLALGSASTPFWTSFNKSLNKPPVKSLMPVGNEVPKADDPNLEQGGVSLIVRLIENPNYVVSVATEQEEIAVWDLSSCKKVRSLKGVPHPISLKLIDDVTAVVLCRRELRIYNLDDGVLVTKLKGVMNQKMAYYGLHDKSHLVALSRNRMYVNLMHLESGDCVTTFKAGEDRFLNSLLVSGDGRILVCGDETQKPFPLLVWNLASRKLLYDLRIPHHDFVTNLSAITHEGHYVCCVAKEVIEPGPNFIVVYDLQNGTLFKKWKPGVDTTSLDISSKDSCVISGLADARILVWDLVTGNCRWSLRGHSAPVTLVQRDPCGGCFLSADVLNRDRSIRLWDLHKGELLAVYTPQKPFTSCELGKGGKRIALSLKGENTIRSLVLKGPGIECPENKTHYGKEENHGKTFTLTENDDAKGDNTLTT